MPDPANTGREPEPDSTDAEIPAVVDRESFEAQLDALRAREKAHTHEGDGIAAARRRLPMVEVDSATGLTGPDGPLTPRSCSSARIAALSVRRLNRWIHLVRERLGAVVVSPGRVAGHVGAFGPARRDAGAVCGHADAGVCWRWSSGGRAGRLGSAGRGREGL